MVLDAGMRSFAAALVVLALVTPWACRASSAGATPSVLPLLADKHFEESVVTRPRAIDGYQVDSSVLQALDRKIETHFACFYNRRSAVLVQGESSSNQLTQASSPISSVEAAAAAVWATLAA